MLRVPSKTAVAAPDNGAPPDATTPTKANCEAPVKTKRLRAQACQTLSPEATAIAPNDSP
jgi:hypothetical protein